MVCPICKDVIMVLENMLENNATEVSKVEEAPLVLGQEGGKWLSNTPCGKRGSEA